MEDYCNEKDLDEFFSKVKEGLKKGSKEYGHAGFAKNNVFLMIEEELRDVAAYAFLGVQKMKRMRGKFMQDVKGENDETSAKAS